MAVRIALIAVLSLVSLPVGNAAIIVIDFEFFPGVDGLLGTADDVPITAVPTGFVAQTVQLTTEFSSLGLLFTSPVTEDANEILDAASFTTPAGHTPPNLLASSGALTISGTFTVPVSEVGALLGISGGADTLEIFDSGGTSLGTVTGDDVFASISSATLIASFTITATTGTTPAIDNFTFTTVPEPSSFALLGLALAGLGWRRRRSS